MNKTLNLVIRILGIAAAIAACVFAYLLKGKMETAMVKTTWTTTDAEISAPKDYDNRMTAIGTSVKALLETKRTKIAELESNIKDLQADVADKKTKIEGLTANVSTLEGERAELTRKRDELTAQVTEANSKKDSIAAELEQAKKEIAADKEKIGALFTKEQLEAESAKATKAQENRDAVSQKYAQLFNWTVSNTGNKPPFPRDPLAEPTVDTAQVEFGPETLFTKIVVIDPSKGLVAFSVGELNGIKVDAGFEVRINDRKVGTVRISSVKSAMCFAQILSGSELSAFTRNGAVTLVPFTGKIANN
jgi:hypothetical protein